MSSERRLHPLSFLFAIGARIKDFALPLLIVLVTAGRSGIQTWQLWLLLFIVPTAVIAIGRTLTFRYRFDEHELVIRSGLISRNERHVPYTRIQNVDGVQTLFHRLLKVMDVKVQTGGGNEPEATMSVLPVAAFEEMRLRVFEGRRRAADGVGATATDEAPGAAAAATAPAPAARTLLRLSPRELLTYGFVEGRGMVVLAAVFGLYWEFGMADRMMPWGPFEDMVLSDEQRPRASRRGVFRELARAASARAGYLFESVVLAALALIALLVFVRLLSMVWAAIRMHGFVLTRDGDDLRTEYGLFTRVAATIPIGRIQTLTLKEGPLHRLVGGMSARIDTAGGEAGQNAPPDRHWLAPIARRAQVPGLISEIMPALSLDALDWQPVHPRAFTRKLRESLVVAAIGSALAANVLGWRALILFALLVPLSIYHARRGSRALGWAMTDDLVAFRSGWLWRHVTVAPLARVQTVAFHESPFDRRHRMASVRVDTAGAGDLSHRIAIPFLGRDVAATLWRRLAHEAAVRRFRWS
jgi:putative membrane protein